MSLRFSFGRLPGVRAAMIAGLLAVAAVGRGLGFATRKARVTMPTTADAYGSMTVLTVEPGLTKAEGEALRSAADEQLQAGGRWFIVDLSRCGVCDSQGLEDLLWFHEKATLAGGLVKVGERIQNLARWYNIQNGRTRKDDTLPKRFFAEPHEAGIFKGRNMTEEVFGQWLDIYYQQRGWDTSGAPTPAKMTELGLAGL